MLPDRPLDEKKKEIEINTRAPAAFEETGSSNCHLSVFNLGSKFTNKNFSCSLLKELIVSKFPLRLTRTTGSTPIIQTLHVRGETSSNISWIKKKKKCINKKYISNDQMTVAREGWRRSMEVVSELRLCFEGIFLLHVTNLAKLIWIVHIQMSKFIYIYIKKNNNSVRPLSSPGWTEVQRTEREAAATWPRWQSWRKEMDDHRKTASSTCCAWTWNQPFGLLTKSVDVS